MLFKSIAIILSTLLIAAVQISTANAGCGGGHGGHRAAQKSVLKKQAVKQSKARKQRAVAAAKQKKQVTEQASAETTAQSESTTDTAGVSATATSDEPTPAKDAPLTVAGTARTCTKFIAATGTTVTVDCAIQ